MDVSGENKPTHSRFIFGLASVSFRNSYSRSSLRWVDCGGAETLENNTELQALQISVSSRLFPPPPTALHTNCHRRHILPLQARYFAHTPPLATQSRHNPPTRETHVHTNPSHLFPISPSTTTLTSLEEKNPGCLCREVIYTVNMVIWSKALKCRLHRPSLLAVDPKSSLVWFELLQN